MCGGVRKTGVEGARSPSLKKIIRTHCFLQSLYALEKLSGPFLISDVP
jgi:hypothetical protein